MAKTIMKNDKQLDILMDIDKIICIYEHEIRYYNFNLNLLKSQLFDLWFEEDILNHKSKIITKTFDRIFIIDKLTFKIIIMNDIESCSIKIYKDIMIVQESNDYLFKFYDIYNGNIIKKINIDYSNQTTLIESTIIYDDYIIISDVIGLIYDMYGNLINSIKHIGEFD